eukprot:COSAG01_NODE_7048_length_3376_cov_40.918828_5_plen_134_part_01
MSAHQLLLRAAARCCALLRAAAMLCFEPKTNAAHLGEVPTFDVNMSDDDDPFAADEIWRHDPFAADDDDPFAADDDDPFAADDDDPFALASSDDEDAFAEMEAMLADGGEDEESEPEDPDLASSDDEEGDTGPD